MTLGGKDVPLSHSPAPEPVDGQNRREGELETQLESTAVLGDDDPGSYNTVHGHPITISQCTFQAHIARVRTEAEVRAAIETVSAATEHEAVFSHFVWPFAYRLAYRFVIDRAKKLLENTDLASLRRAVEADIHPPTPAVTNTNLYAHEHAAGGSPAGPVGWDRFVVPISARRRISGHTAQGDLLGAPRASGGSLVLPPCNSTVGGGFGGGGGGRGGNPRAKNANNAYAGCCGASGAGSTRTRARRVLSLGHLSISSKTVPFPRGHVPSVMGAKGHGKKRGRINHFAVRTPGGSWGDGEFDTGVGGRYVGDGVDLFDGTPSNADSRSSADAVQGGRALASGWSLPHELDPTYHSTTDPDKAVTTRERENGGGSGSASGSASANNCSAHTASRVSTCDTINSPGRVATIMLGVTGVHTALPPPYTNNASEGDGDGSSTSGEFSCLDAASSSDINTDGSSFADPRRRPQPLLPGMTASGATGGHFAESDGTTSWVGDVFQPHLGGGGGGGMAAFEGAGFSSSPSAVWAGGHEVLTFPGVDGTPTGRPLLHRAPGSGVRDEPPLSLVIVPGDGGGHRGGGGGGGDAVPVPLSNASSVGRWKSDDDGASTTSSTAGGGGVDGVVRGRDGAEMPAGNNNNTNPQPSLLGFALVDRHQDGPDGRRAAFPAGTGEGPPATGSVAGRKECDTPATWGSDDAANLRGMMVSGRSDPPPTRSKSALRGWSVGRTAPACSPLATQERGAQPGTGR
eukprot:g5721.t1